MLFSNLFSRRKFHSILFLLSFKINFATFPVACRLRAGVSNMHAICLVTTMDTSQHRPKDKNVYPRDLIM